MPESVTPSGLPAPATEPDPFHVGRIVRRHITIGDEDADEYGRIIARQKLPDSVTVAWDGPEQTDGERVGELMALRDLTATGWISGAPGGIIQQSGRELEELCENLAQAVERGQSLEEQLRRAIGGRQLSDAGRATAEKAARDAQEKLAEKTRQHDHDMLQAHQLLELTNTGRADAEKAMRDAQRELREMTRRRDAVLATCALTEEKLVASEAQVREQSASLLAQRTEIETLRAELARAEHLRDELDRRTWKEKFETEARNNAALRQTVDEKTKAAERAREAQRAALQEHNHELDVLHKAHADALAQVATLTEQLEDVKDDLANESARADGGRTVVVNLNFRADDHPENIASVLRAIKDSA